MVHRMLVNVAGEGDCTKTREESRRELEIGLRRIYDLDMSGSGRNCRAERS